MLLCHAVVEASLFEAFKCCHNFADDLVRDVDGLSRLPLCVVKGYGDAILVDNGKEAGILWREVSDGAANSITRTWY